MKAGSPLAGIVNDGGVSGSALLSHHSAGSSLSAAPLFLRHPSVGEAESLHLVSRASLPPPSSHPYAHGPESLDHGLTQPQRSRQPLEAGTGGAGAGAGDGEPMVSQAATGVLVLPRLDASAGLGDAAGTEPAMVPSPGGAGPGACAARRLELLQSHLSPAPSLPAGLHGSGSGEPVDVKSCRRAAGVWTAVAHKMAGSHHRRARTCFKTWADVAAACRCARAFDLSLP